jgi:hypothetical protein
MKPKTKLEERLKNSIKYKLTETISSKQFDTEKSVANTSLLKTDKSLDLSDSEAQDLVC